MFFIGELQNSKNIPVRVHSECLTGDVFHSLKCDCGEQLDYAIRYIKEQGKGMIIYLRQEGRGIGLFNKVNAYALQDHGQNTIEANESLGFEADLRTYDCVKPILDYLKIQSVSLLSNNPEKIEAFKKQHIVVEEVLPIRVGKNNFNEDYLSVKKEQMNHLL